MQHAAALPAAAAIRLIMALHAAPSAPMHEWQPHSPPRRQLQRATRHRAVPPPFPLAATAVPPPLPPAAAGVAAAGTPAPAGAGGDAAPPAPAAPPPALPPPLPPPPLRCSSQNRRTCARRAQTHSHEHKGHRPLQLHCAQPRCSPHQLCQQCCRMPHNTGRRHVAVPQHAHPQPPPNAPTCGRAPVCRCMPSHRRRRC